MCRWVGMKGVTETELRRRVCWHWRAISRPGGMALVGSPSCGMLVPLLMVAI